MNMTFQTHKKSVHIFKTISKFNRRSTK